VRQIVTDAANPVDDSRFDYTGYGLNDTEKDYSGLPFNAKCPYKFAGTWGYYDGSGRGSDQTADAMTLCGHRFYSPGIARWLTEDPIGFAGGWSLYGYCRNLPSLKVDPMGLEDGSLTDQIVGHLMDDFWGKAVKKLIKKAKKPWEKNMRDKGYPPSIMPREDWRPKFGGITSDIRDAIDPIDTGMGFAEYIGMCQMMADLVLAVNIYGPGKFGEAVDQVRRNAVNNLGFSPDWEEDYFKPPDEDRTRPPSDGGVPPSGGGMGGGW
jgi:RHS repeat-associated protein